ncbi:F510_1955 family glycosylhydrolase [uncultured Modestobacter sp.]|uniref:F510_1955 family glycosylhydrolase n=1 Tax=uncultured Modestobacter sp. TaxID=380048 RepID=UPI002606AC91|nr:exo-alpha-sialidase [uncultured Modestobacter sp.]
MARSTVGVLAVAALSACSTASGETTTSSSAAPHLETDPPDFNHVHGVAGEAGSDAVLVAAHNGLFRLSADGDVQVGPTIDLMGFAVAAPGRYLASGHPGPGVDLPEPVGLIESVDQGQSWQPLSRQGQSDFHALTASPAGVLGYDGTLQRSTDGLSWEQLQIPSAPASLSAGPDGNQVLATTEQGLLHSTDAGSTWAPIPGAPLLQLVDWSPDGGGAVGVDPQGQVWTSQDRALTWQPAADLAAPPQAMDVGSTPDGGSRVLVVTGSAIAESRDGGQTFTDLRD